MATALELALVEFRLRGFELKYRMSIGRGGKYAYFQSLEGGNDLRNAEIVHETMSISRMYPENVTEAIAALRTFLD
jgi:hypothetical protein